MRQIDRPIPRASLHTVSLCLLAAGWMLFPDTSAAARTGSRAGSGASTCGRASTCSSTCA